MVGLGLYLDVFGSESHVLVWVLRIFLEKKIAKRSKEGKLGKSGLRRSEVLHHSKGCLAAARPNAKLASYTIVKALFTKAKIFGFCSESLVFVP